MKRICTVFKEDCVKADLFEYIKDNIIWTEGIKSHNRVSRKQAFCNMSDNPEDVHFPIVECVKDTLNMFKKDIVGNILGIYLNYYENGNDWCPMHSHPGTMQLVISFGATRTLKVGTKLYSMTNKSAILFGSSSHGIEKDDTQEGRISIAVFLKK
jgi:hypothetical protein